MGIAKVEHGSFAEYRCRRLRTREVILLMVLLVTYAYTGNNMAAEFCRLAPGYSTSDDPAAFVIERLLCGSSNVVSLRRERPCLPGSFQTYKACGAPRGAPRAAASDTTAMGSISEEVCSIPPTQLCNVREASNRMAIVATLSVQLLRRMLVSHSRD